MKRIGSLNFKDYAAKKPVSLSPSGKYLMADDIVKTPALSLSSMFTLSKREQLKLALKRYQLEPDFKLAIIGVGVMSKKEVIEHLKEQTEFGKQVLEAEMNYCNELIYSITKRKKVLWPKIPKRVIPKGTSWKWVKKCFWLRLPNQVLFCENMTDMVTTPFANYRIANVHPAFSARNFTVVSLTGTDDIRTNFIPEAKKARTVYINGIGHGSYTAYTGHGGNRILEVGQYDAAEVKDKSIHFLSCQTAKQLGPDTVSNGAKSYAGYIENFILQWDDSSTPVNEFLLFARSDSTYDLMMANGATAKQAYDATIQAFNAAINQVPNTVAATYLTLDRDRLRLIGDQSAVIRPYRYVKFCFPIRSLKQIDALAEAGEWVD